MKTLIALSLLVTAVFGAATLGDFELYCQKFAKSYDSKNATERAFRNFQASVERIKAANEESYGLNKFSDLSIEEFSQQRLCRRVTVTPDAVKDNYLVPFNETTDEAEIDWRIQGYVTAVKDQSDCGSCWAFSAVEECESVWIKDKKGTNTTTILSPQQVVDCDKEDDGCNGGDLPTAYDYIKSAGGLELEKNYPYKARDQSCKFKKSEIAMEIKGYSYATSHTDETKLAASLSEYGPISICVNAMPWLDYSHGIFKGSCPGGDYDLDHCVQLVGMGEDRGTKYWLVRNSWARDWGENGYIRIERDAKNKCGIATEAIVVQV